MPDGLGNIFARLLGGKHFARLLLRETFCNLVMRQNCSVEYSLKLCSVGKHFETLFCVEVCYKLVQKTV